MNKKQRIEKVYSLSPMQDGILFHSQMVKQTDLYFRQAVFSVSGKIDLPVLEKSFDKLIERYEVLRTAFVYKELEKPRQVVLKNRKMPVHFDDITALSPGEQDAFLEKSKKEDREKGFDLTRDILMRVAVFLTRENSYTLIWSFHHIMMDGWCLGIIYKDFVLFYQSLKEGLSFQLEPVTPYKEYIDWIAQQDPVEGLDYWEKYLSGYSQVAAFPRFEKKRDREEYKTEEYKLTIDETLTGRIAGFAAQHNLTLNTLFQTVWGILLQKYNSTGDVVFGTVVSGRPTDIPGLDRAVGLFINTIPLRVKSLSTSDFFQVAKEVQRALVMSKAYEYLSLADIQAKSELKGNLIDHIVVFENYPVQKEIKNAGGQQRFDFTINSMDMEEQSNYNLSIGFIPGHRVKVRFAYNALIYQRKSIQEIARRFRDMFIKVIDNPRVNISDLDILNEEEKHQILFDFNDTQTGFPARMTLHQLFEEQAGKEPTHPALLFEDSEISYRTLNENANRLAGMLRAKGVNRESIVALLLDRSIHMITAILAVLKAGGAYMPLEPGTPPGRLRVMLNDGGVSILLTQSSIVLDDLFTARQKELQQIEGIAYSHERDKTRPAAGDREILRLDRLDRQIESFPTGNLENVNSSDDLCYVMFTSGSTGKPKGTLISHKNVIRVVKNTNYIEITPDDRFLLMSNYAFDGSVYDIYGALLNGALLVLAKKEDVLSIDRLSRLIADRGITSFFITAALFNTLVDLDVESLKGTRKIIFGGERASLEHTRRAFDYLGEGRVLQVYGPTETAVYATCNVIREVNEALGSVSIGPPLSNTLIYILDKNMKPVPVGVPGEIYIGGDGVSRGYMNNPGLTMDRFVANPFVPGDRIYRSGDLARWLPGGEVEFLERIDRQVKIRGFRIELGEIENHLRKIDFIKEAVVIDRQNKNGDKYLCAYIVPDMTMEYNKSGIFNPSECGLNVTSLRNLLSRNLPDYIIPTFFVHLDAIPLTPNKKVDINALPEPQIQAGCGESTAPLNEIEEKLLNIWSGVLGVDKASVGVTSNFFELGGHSLKSTLMAAKIMKEFNVNIPLEEIFTSPTIRELAAYIENAVKQDFVPIDAVEEKEYYPLSSAQTRMFIQQEKNRALMSYNIPVFMNWEGGIDIARLQDAVQKLLDRHEILKSSFHVIRDEPVQRIHPHVQFQLESYILSPGQSNGEVDRIVETFVRPFDLTCAPLLRVGFVETGRDSGVLLVDMHHIITDGMSMTIFIKDFAAIYDDRPLPPLRIHYKDFAHWLNHLIRTGELRKQEAFWLKQFESQITVFDLPFDYERPGIRHYQGNSVAFDVADRETDALKQLAKQHNTTLFVVLLSIYNVFLSRLSGKTDIIVATGTAGRKHPDLEPVIGMFVNTLVLRNAPLDTLTFTEFLNRVRKRTMAAFENQDYQFEELVKRVVKGRDMSRNPLFDVGIAFQNIDIPELKIPDATLTPYEYKNRTSRFDLVLDVREEGENLVFMFDYSTELFKEETIGKFTRYFKEILVTVLENPSVRLEDIKISHAFYDKKISNPKIDFGF